MKLLSYSMKITHIIKIACIHTCVCACKYTHIHTYMHKVLEMLKIQPLTIKLESVLVTSWSLFVSLSSVLTLQVDVFAFGIVLCEIIARIQADPDILPRTEVLTTSPFVTSQIPLIVTCSSVAVWLDRWRAAAQKQSQIMLLLLCRCHIGQNKKPRSGQNSC